MRLALLLVLALVLALANGHVSSKAHGLRPLHALSTVTNSYCGPQDVVVENSNNVTFTPNNHPNARVTLRVALHAIEVNNYPCGEYWVETWRYCSGDSSFCTNSTNAQVIAHYHEDFGGSQNVYGNACAGGNFYNTWESCDTPLAGYVYSECYNDNVFGDEDFTGGWTWGNGYNTYQGFSFNNPIACF